MSITWIDWHLSQTTKASEYIRRSACFASRVAHRLASPRAKAQGDNYATHQLLRPVHRGQPILLKSRRLRNPRSTKQSRIESLGQNSRAKVERFLDGLTFSQTYPRSLIPPISLGFTRNQAKRKSTEISLRISLFRFPTLRRPDLARTGQFITIWDVLSLRQRLDAVQSVSKFEIRNLSATRPRIWLAWHAQADAQNAELVID